MKLWKKSTLGLLAVAAVGAPLTQAAPKFSAADYKKALWMATRFYGGQRSGAGPNWLLIGLADNLQQSFTRDAYQGKDVSGGWFDCGDHVMFGQTQYWSAYALAKAYEAFPEGYDDFYNGVDYSDYRKSGKWNDTAGGTPNGIPDLIDELVYETDYIAKAAISATEFVSLKGDGTKDHNRWVTPGMMSKMSAGNGGECLAGGEEKYELNSSGGYTFQGNLTACTSYGSRLVMADPDRTMSSYGAATLAVMSRILTRLGIYPERAALYATKAKLAYQAATSTTASVAYGPFYSANAHTEDDYVAASVEMYLLTGDASYKTNAQGKLSGVNASHNWAFCYSNNDDIAYYDMATGLGDAGSKTKLTTYANYYKGKINSEGVSAVGDPSWGTLRYPASAGYVMALANQASGNTTYDDAIFQQIDFILGANSNKQSYLTGFQKDATYKMPQHPHHRALYQRNDNPDDNAKAKMTIPTKNQSHGSLVGSQGFTSSGYIDDVIQYKYTEVCTDYNVGLVGALGYAVSKLAPVDTSKFRKASTGISRPATVGDLQVSRTATGHDFAFGPSRLVSGEAFDLAGRRVAVLTAKGDDLSWNVGSTAPGVYHVRVRTAEGQSLTRSVVVR